MVIYCLLTSECVESCQPYINTGEHWFLPVNSSRSPQKLEGCVEEEEGASLQTVELISKNLRLNLSSVTCCGLWQIAFHL